MRLGVQRDVERQDDATHTTFADLFSGELPTPESKGSLLVECSVREIDMQVDNARRRLLGLELSGPQESDESRRGKQLI
jgi:hypothetical protein